MLTDDGVGPQVVKQFGPSRRRRQQAVNEQHRNLAGLIRLQHVDAHFVLKLVRGQEPLVLQDISVAARQPIRQWRGQIALERYGRSIGLSGLIDDRIEQLEPVVGALIGFAFVEAEESRDRKIKLPRKSGVSHAGRLRGSLAHQWYP